MNRNETEEFNGITNRQRKLQTRFKQAKTAVKHRKIRLKEIADNNAKRGIAIKTKRKRHQKNAAINSSDEMMVSIQEQIARLEKSLAGEF